MKTLDNAKIIEKAFKKNQLHELLRGEGDLKLLFPPMFPVNLPTYWYDILDEGFYPRYRRDGTKILSLFEKELHGIIIDNLGAYSAMGILLIQLVRERDRLSPFNIKTELIVNKLSDYIRNNEDSLKQDKRWDGALNPNGLWDELIRMCKMIKEKFGIVICY